MLIKSHSNRHKDYHLFFKGAVFFCVLPIIYFIIMADIRLSHAGHDNNLKYRNFELGKNFNTNSKDWDCFIFIDRTINAGKELSVSDLLFRIHNYMCGSDVFGTPFQKEVLEKIGGPVITGQFKFMDYLVIVQSIKTKGISVQPVNDFPRNLVIVSVMIITAIIGFLVIILFSKDKKKAVRKILKWDFIVLWGIIIGFGIGSMPAMYLGNKLTIHEFWIDNATDKKCQIVVDSSIKLTMPAQSNMVIGLRNGPHKINVYDSLDGSIIEEYNFNLGEGGAKTFIYNVSGENKYLLKFVRYVPKE